MAELKTNAIVVGRADYREQDRMLTLFSPTHGKIEAVARRAKSQKSPLLACSELFCSGEYVLYMSRDNRASVVSCQLTDSFYPLREDYDRFRMGMYMLEISRNVIQPDQENERLFLLLLRSLAYLTYGTEDPRLVAFVFMMGFLSLCGFRPRVGRCCRCGQVLEKDAEKADTGAFAAFSVDAGGIVCHDCIAPGDIRLTAGDVQAMQQVMHRGLGVLENSEPLEISENAYRALQDMIRERTESQTRSERI